LYLEYRSPSPEEPTWSWPERLLPLGDWGCHIYSCLDCTTEEGRILRCAPGDFDPESGVDSFEAISRFETASIREWLLPWLDGRDQTA
jgi:hypothetical protein